MDKAEALAYVSRLFDAAQAGAVLWGDKLLLKRFLEHINYLGRKVDGLNRDLEHLAGGVLDDRDSAADLRDRLQRELDARELVTCWLIVLHQLIQIVLPCPVPTAIAPAFLRLGWR